MASLIFLDAGVQNYAWGKPAASSFVAQMKQLSADHSGKMYAELWVGTHPSCPTHVLPSSHSLTHQGSTAGLQTLEEYLKTGDHMQAFFSPAHQSSAFANTVPYLLKILSVNSALSIQAHPCKALAEKLHAQNPDKYKDPNHKPELLCALTPF
uniref:Mannose-6-phosphate isomerase n=1 Tax=Lygus hesperus TaxID=30085 RepID=A0A0A9WMH9_LYGHE